MTAPREPTLKELCALLWQGRLFLAVGLFLGVACGIGFLAFAVPQYKASMIVSPVARTGTTDMDGPRSRDGSFATEYMLKSFSPGDSADFAWFEHIVRGPSVAARLLAEPAIRAGLAHDREFSFQKANIPQSAEELSGWLEKRVAVEPMGSTPLRRITYDHPDRIFARTMLQAMADSADAIIREQMKAKADKRIAWLRGTIERTQNPDYRRALAALLMEQEQMRMMLALDEPYAARIAEPPSASARPAWPRRALFLPVFALCGLILGMAAHGVRIAFATP